MPANTDRQRFRNEELILQVSTSVDRERWNESRYEAFIDELCGTREYQKEAIRITLRYWLSGNYSSLTELAEENFNDNPSLTLRYGPWAGMQQHLQLPNQLSASLDLATGTGKSYVLYGLAAIMLAEGIVDQVLVLCPSTTIEMGLLEKFRELASDENLRALLPSDTQISAPHIINASETIIKGSICVENYHAVLEHVGSSIRQSLKGKGTRTVVLNDEAHHVANESSAKTKKWKEFLANPDYNFRYVIGVSGTCYINDDYFADVIYRYSLRQAIEELYVKKIEYIAEMPHTGDPDEKWQLIRNRHEDAKRKLKRRGLLPLTIIVTSKINRCKDVADELKGFLEEAEGITSQEANDRVLVVYNNAPDVARLPYVDNANSKVEWIVSVSMLNEGWDVKRVFQIVPHEERAFNSKLLIAQVLGRGLRVPKGWDGEQAQVTVFNHDAWAGRIRYLVSEILEIERRLSSHIIHNSPFNFTLHNIDYTLEPTSVKTSVTSDYTPFEKGYIELPADVSDQDVNVEFERAETGTRYRWQTRIKRKTFSAREIAVHMYKRMEQEQDPNDPDPIMRTFYTDNYPVERLEEIVKTSLARRGMTEATDNIRQKFLQALGSLRRKASESIRYSLRTDSFYELSTAQRQADSVSAADLRRDKAIFITTQTRDTLDAEQIEFLDEVKEPGSAYRHHIILNPLDFKTPLNAVIADSDPERRFINFLLDPQNLSAYDKWLKSTAARFYEIDYTWRKGEHPKKGKFNPDFFISVGDLIVVVETKGDGELSDPSEENRKKWEYANAHFSRINSTLEQQGSSIRYTFNFLTPKNFATFFQFLREGRVTKYKSELDVKLSER
jgi:type III restriction enzyme